MARPSETNVGEPDHPRRTVLGGVQAHPLLAIDTAYHSFRGDGTMAGGDWFDVVSIDEAHVGLVIGDVVGHGFDPAATMGQLRWAINALLAADVPVASAVATVRGMCRQHRIAASIAVVRWNLETGHTLTTIAGHPSPLVVERSGTRRLADGTPAPYLGAPFDCAEHAVEGRVAPDATLVLFTDGLLSRRIPPHQALAEVERVAISAIGSRDDPAGALLELVHRDDHDDAAVLVVGRRLP